MHISAFGIHHVKDINLYENIKQYFEDKKPVKNKKGKMENPNGSYEDFCI